MDIYIYIFFLYFVKKQENLKLYSMMNLFHLLKLIRWISNEIQLIFFLFPLNVRDTFHINTSLNKSQAWHIDGTTNKKKHHSISPGPDI